jgi:hypothetical protein
VFFVRPYVLLLNFDFFQRGIKMLKQLSLRVAGVLCGFLLSVGAIQAPAQTPQTQPSAESVFAHVNRHAVLSRAGDPAATAELSHQLFRNVAIPIELADVLGFSDRMVQAETEYRKGNRPAVHEADIVKAVNNLTNTIGAPQWAHTSQAEVRKLRMHMLVLYPQLMGTSEASDAKGRYKAVSEKLGPMEAAYLATTLLYQKAFNAEYQFTDAEQTQNAALDAATVNAKHLERVQALQDLLHGKTQSISVRDLLTASDHFFSDFGIEPNATVGTVRAAGAIQVAAVKGVQ